MKQFKSKKCKNCKMPFIPRMQMQPVGHPNDKGHEKCALEYGKKQQAKEYKAKTKEIKREYRKSDLKIRKAAAKKACHDYIKLRDKGNMCICCNKPINDTIQAGHWKESGNNPKIRYHEDNIHVQSLHCNYFKGGDSGDYEKNLRTKIGDDRVDYLLENLGSTVKRTADDYKEIERAYKEKIKML